MDYEKDVLTDFESKVVEKSKYFSALIFLFFSYILFLSFFTFFDLHPKLQIRKDIEWELVFIIIALPLIGIILLVKKNKFGWAICLFYNLLTTLSFMAAFLQPFFKMSSNNLYWY